MKIRIKKVPKLHNIINAYGGFLDANNNLFDLGGDIQTHGADFSTGLTHIDKGGSHEENPNQGVQMGVDSEGNPNLVEEGETVYNDYVFSNRIEADEETLKAFHLPKKSHLTYADISKKFEKEIKEKPYFPDVQNTFNSKMQDLAQHQERQKQEEAARQAQAEFASMSPQEQVAIMQQMGAQQQAAQEQQMAQEQAIQEQAAQEQMMAQQGGMSPEQIMQQQMMQGQASQMAAYGGQLNLYPGGGKLKDLTPEQRRALVFSLLGIDTESQYNNILNDPRFTHSSIPANYPSDINYGDYLGYNSDFWNKEDFYNDALLRQLISTSGNPILKHLMENNYDFGALEYSPTSGSGIDFSNVTGDWNNWKAWLDENNQDAAYLELAAREGYNKDDLLKKDRKALGELIASTDAYKEGTKKLKEDENLRLAYLTGIVTSNAPEKAKEYARRFIRQNKETGKWEWIPGIDRKYENTLQKERENNLGSYWHTPKEWKVQEAVNKNWLVNPDGSIKIIEGDPKDYTFTNKYQWANNTYNYYKRSEKDAKEWNRKNKGIWERPENMPTGKNSKDDWEPRHRAEWLRYAGIFGPALGLALQGLGVGKPDTSSLDASLEFLRGEGKAAYRPIGNYLTYRPMDTWQVLNRMNASSRATDRAIANSANNMGMQMAGNIANGYKDVLGAGELERQAMNYNKTDEARVGEYNKDTEKFNANAFNQVSLANADAKNRISQARAQLAAQNAATKLGIDASWSSGLYGNLAGIFKGAADVGMENAEWNMIGDMVAHDIFRNIDPSGPLGSRVYKPKKNSNACGGKLKRRKKGGLTY